MEYSWIIHGISWITDEISNDWLVVEPTPLQKNVKSSWDEYSPKQKGKITHVPNHQPNGVA